MYTYTPVYHTMIIIIIISRIIIVTVTIIIITISMISIICMRIQYGFSISYY